jgi:hypothetical protein
MISSEIFNNGSVLIEVVAAGKPKYNRKSEYKVKDSKKLVHLCMIGLLNLTESQASEGYNIVLANCSDFTYKIFESSRELPSWEWEKEHGEEKKDDGSCILF